MVFLKPKRDIYIYIYICIIIYIYIHFFIYLIYLYIFSSYGYIPTPKFKIQIYQKSAIFSDAFFQKFMALGVMYLRLRFPHEVCGPQRLLQWQELPRVVLHSCRSELDFSRGIGWKFLGNLYPPSHFPYENGWV